MSETKKKAPSKEKKATSVKDVKEAPAVETGASSIEKVKAELPPIDYNYVVQLASAVHGKLIWESKTSGYKVTWNEFGEEMPFTVKDLFDMRNGTREFFTKNWVTIEDDRADEVLKFLGVDKFYKHIRSIKDVDNIILETEAEDIVDIVSEFPHGAKEIVAQRAFELKQEGILDSSKTIKAIEEATNYTLDE